MLEEPAPETVVEGRPRWKKVMGSIAIVLFVVFAYLWFGIRPKVPLRPVRMTRAADGTLRPMDESQSGVSFEMQAGAIRANNSFASGSSSSHCGHARFASRRIMIFNRSDQLLMACVGKDLLERLKTLSFLEQVDYFPYGFRPEPGGQAPDVCISIDLNDLKCKGIVQEDVEARIAVSMFNGPPGCRNSNCDQLTPPVIQLDWNGYLDHKSTTSGVASSAAQYNLVAADIGKQIFDALSAGLKQYRDKESVLPKLPDDFSPHYRKCPDLPLDGLGTVEMLFTWRGLMNHNETLWRFTPDRPADEALTELQRRMKKSGWKGEIQSSELEKQHPYLRMTNKAAVLTAYAPEPTGMPTPPDARAKQPQIMLHYVDRMSEDEVRAALDRALAAGASFDTLILFESLWSEKQSRQIIQRFAAHPLRTPQASLALANLYHRLHQDDKARDELRRTLALTNTVNERGDLDSRTRELAKTLKDEKLPDRPIDRKVYLELGFLELTPDAKIPPADVAADEPLHFFFSAKNGKLNTVSLSVLKNSATDFQVRVVQSMEYGHSTSSGGTSAGVSLENGAMANFMVDRPDARGRYRVTTMIRKN